jgi:hypothetical protein
VICSLFSKIDLVFICNLSHISNGPKISYLTGPAQPKNILPENAASAIASRFLWQTPYPFRPIYNSITELESFAGYREVQKSECPSSKKTFKI